MIFSDSFVSRISFASIDTCSTKSLNTSCLLSIVGKPIIPNTKVLTL